MKLLIDMTSAQPEGAVAVNGGGEYSILLLERLCAHAVDSDKIEVILDSRRGNNKKLEEIVRAQQLHVYQYNNLRRFSSLVKASQCEVLVLPVCYFWYANLKIDDSVRIVAAIHDLSSIVTSGRLKVKYGKYPKQDHLNAFRKMADVCTRKARHAVSISLHEKAFHINDNEYVYTPTNYTKNAFIKYFDISNSDDIGVFYDSDVRPNVQVTGEQNVLSTYGLENKKYFMLSAGCRWTKNNAIAIFTLDRMFSNRKYGKMLEGFKVILLGTDVDSRSYMLRRIKNGNRFIFDGYVSDNAIEVLYKNAFMYIFPSVLEGFGLPPIEAMKYGTLVSCSTSMCIPEVCGDGAVYFDPCDMDSIELAILKGFDKGFSVDQAHRGLVRYEELQAKGEKDMGQLVSKIFGER